MRKLKMLLAVVPLAAAACGPLPGSSYSYSDAAPAVLALNAAIQQASLAPITNVCCDATVGGTLTHTFNGYYSASGTYVTAPYTLTGSITESTTLNGTVNFTGGNVTQITFNNVATYPTNTGTYTISFKGGLVYTYNLATGTFTLT